jgi:S1-C subfamily serine protease
MQIMKSELFAVRILLGALLTGLICCALTGITEAAPQSQGKNTPTDLALDQSKAVVLLEPLDERGRPMGQGSGFIVSPSGAIVTNLHVVQGATTVRVRLPGGDTYQTSDLVDIDPLKDIAVIKVRGFQLPVVKLGDSDRSTIGESIVAISSPEGLTNSLSTGVISGIRRLETHRVFQITAPISEGSSGGALFNSEGQVIGITTYILRSGQNINFALPINYVRGMISDRVTSTLAAIPAQAAASTAPVQPGTESERTSSPLDSDINPAARRKFGRTADTPMFVRSDEALALLYRLVDGIGKYTYSEIEEVTRTAAPIKTIDTATVEQYTIKYLTFHEGLAMNFRKSDGRLESVELLVNWTITDLERAYGDKYKKRTIDGEKVLEFKKDQDKRQAFAHLDLNGAVRAIRFVETK